MRKSQFKLDRVKGSPVDNTELISDLKRVAEQLKSKTVSQKKYTEIGTYDYSTLIRRFGSWNKALQLADLSISNEINISDNRLFENLLILWQHYGRQPRRSELAKAPSTISQAPYNRRFRSWTNALKAFVSYANAREYEAKVLEVTPTNKRNVIREPSLRLRWKVLQRDRFTCQKCGASPALKLGVELHVDHITPYSKGGKTEIDNLQTFCSACNLGKSNLQ
jgi:hypothetical protein